MASVTSTGACPPGGRGAPAREELDAGASLVQLYTDWIYGAPGLVPAICRGLAD